MSVAFDRVVGAAHVALGGRSFSFRDGHGPNLKSLLPNLARKNLPVTYTDSCPTASVNGSNNLFSACPPFR
ncbi:MAG: hypothetical protein KAR37_05860, partial [Alphaproteobacteria bacterium]|nr:hypothetical protein [Alphaproteobacteria bacterium]